MSYPERMERLDNFAAILQQDHENILRDWRQRVRSLPRLRALDRLTLEDGFRSFLDEITNALVCFHDTHELPKETQSAAIEHGQQRFEIGADITQVVIEYSMLRNWGLNAGLPCNPTADPQHFNVIP